MSDPSIADRALLVRTTADDTALEMARAMSIAEKRDVNYGKWVEVDYFDGIEQIFQNYADDEPQPFSYLKRGGETEFASYDDLLKLENTELWGTSGAFKAKLKAGWMVRMRIFTENFRYFEDNIKSELQDRFSASSFQQTGGGYDEKLFFWLIDENDFISLDIDSEVSNIGVFTLEIGGQRYTISNPAKMDNEATIQIRQVWHWDSNYGTFEYVDEETDPIDHDDGDDNPTDDDVEEHEEEEGENEDDEIEGGNQDDNPDNDDDDDDDDSDDDDDDDDDDDTVFDDASILMVVGFVGIMIGLAIWLARSE
jgi:hypothetical protein